MSQAQVTQRLFLVGCPRSGTTLLQSLLAAHPQIASFPESKFFLNLFPEHEPRRRVLGIASRRARPVLANFCREIGCPDLQARLPWLPQPIDRYAQVFVRSLDRAALRQGKTAWLEKTPEHLHQISAIERFIPTAQVIHIVRSGVDVVASLEELRQTYPRPWGKAFRSLDDCIDTWLGAVAASAAHLNKPNHLLVRYEELVAAPAIELQRLCAFLQLDYSAEMLTNYPASAQALRRGREAWKTGVSGAICSTNAQKFDRLFDSAQQQYIRSRLQQAAHLAEPQRSPQRMS